MHKLPWLTKEEHNAKVRDRNRYRQTQAAQRAAERERNDAEGRRLCELFAQQRRERGA